MTIELVFVLSVVSVMVSILLGLSNLKRASRNDAQQDTTTLTTIIIKLENINDGISKMSSELIVMREEAKELRERLIVTEQSLKSAWKRLEIIEGKADS